MKLNEDLLERVRKGELIVENDNPDVIRELWPNAKGTEKHYVQETIHCSSNGYFTISNSFLKPIIKASELIDEDYAKPLKEGQLCVFFDDLSFFRVMFYFSFLGKIHSHIDHTGTGWNYAFPYKGQTLAEIQEKINSLLKDK